MKPRPKKSAVPPARRHGRRFLVATIIILVLAGAGFAWHTRAEGARVRAALPPRPGLAGRPAALAECLARADARVHSARTRLDGVAELGRLYHANNFSGEAAACWRLLHARQPDEARWCYYLADLSRAASDYEGMAALLQETLRLAPDYTPARLQLANLQFKSGQFTEAARNYRLRLSVLPRDPYAQLGLARLALQAGRTDEARQALGVLLQDSPHFSSAHNLYAELLAVAGDQAGADRHRWLGRETPRYHEPEDAWLDELQAWCYDYDHLCVLGTGELQADRDDRARVLFERAAQLRPGVAQAYELLGDLRLRRHDAAGARDLLEAALPRLDGNQSPVFFATLARAYRELGQPADAARVARTGLARLGNTPELLDALALALADAGEHAAAVAAWQDALAQNPGDAAMNHHLARSLLALNRLDDALAALDHSLVLQPTYLPTLLLRGEIELEAGHPDLAAKYLRPAFNSHPEEADARRLLARWHLQMGAAADAADDPAAENHFRDGLIVEESNPDLLAHLGRYYLNHGRAEAAVSPLLAFHRLQPENPQGCLLLGQAYLATNRREPARAILAEGVRLAEHTGEGAVAIRCREFLRQL